MALFEAQRLHKRFGNRVVLDGVAKATASVRIANQTVLSAAHAVARAKLGFAAPSSRPAASPSATRCGARTKSSI